MVHRISTLKILLLFTIIVLLRLKYGVRLVVHSFLNKDLSRVASYLCLHGFHLINVVLRGLYGTGFQMRRLNSLRLSFLNYADNLIALCKDWQHK